MVLVVILVAGITIWLLRNQSQETAISHPLTVGKYRYPITFTGPISTYNNPGVVNVVVYAVADVFKIYLPLALKK